MHGQRRAAPLQHTLIDDLIQDVFARLLASSAPLAEAREPFRYLVAMARNLYVDRLRRERREALLAGAEMGAMLDKSGLRPNSSEDADHACLSLVDEAAMCAYLESLPPDLFLTYEARFARGLSQRDAATLLGVSRRQLRTREKLVLAGARRLVARSCKNGRPKSEG